MRKCRSFCDRLTRESFFADTTWIAAKTAVAGVSGFR
jgi:hypothetical protein